MFYSISQTCLPYTDKDKVANAVARKREFNVTVPDVKVFEVRVNADCARSLKITLIDVFPIWVLEKRAPRMFANKYHYNLRVHKIGGSNGSIIAIK